ncbi:MAG: M48 family metalloprotease [Armatimonadota bacterium]
MKHSRSLLILLIAIFTLSTICIISNPVYAGPPQNRETKMGREGEKEVEKEYKLLDDPKLLERIQTIAKPIVNIANTVTVEARYGSSDIIPFEYKFKLLDEKSVNAFSLPGGTIYVCKGLLDYAQSDHEIAGVIAHEVAHSAHHHMVKLLREQSKMDGQMAILLLAGMVSEIDSDDLGHLLLGAQLIRTARTSGYGQKAEMDADITAVTYLTKAGYNPVGMLTFLERLAKDSDAKPDIEMGILQTHPAPKFRCKEVLAKIKSFGLPINRRVVVKCLKAVPCLAEVNGQNISQIKLGDKVLFEPAPIENALTSEQRAEAISTKINQLLDTEPQVRDISISPDGKAVVAKGEIIITVSDKDCSLQNKSAGEVASQAAETLKRAIWEEMIDRMY